MTMAGAVTFGLIAIAVVALGALRLLAGSNDDDDIDWNEYSDWERLR
jgi:hypothetical protein